MAECQCFPWNFPKPVGKQFPICTFYGNHCFNAKFRNSTYLTHQCKCLPGCNSIKYEYQIERIHKLTDKEVDEFCPWDSKHFPKLHDRYNLMHGYDDENVYNLMKFHKVFVKGQDDYGILSKNSDNPDSPYSAIKVSIILLMKAGCKNRKDIYA